MAQIMEHRPKPPANRDCCIVTIDAMRGAKTRCLPLAIIALVCRCLYVGYGASKCRFVHARNSGDHHNQYKKVYTRPFHYFFNRFMLVFFVFFLVGSKLFAQPPLQRFYV